MELLSHTDHDSHEWSCFHGLAVGRRCRSCGLSVSETWRRRLPFKHRHRLNAAPACVLPSLTPLCLCMCVCVCVIWCFCVVLCVSVCNLVFCLCSSHTHTHTHTHTNTHDLCSLSSSFTLLPSTAREHTGRAACRYCHQPPQRRRTSPATIRLSLLLLLYPALKTSGMAPIWSKLPYHASCAKWICSLCSVV